jgi:two-component system, NarL family, nitrate/nitrite response regulator NarL
MKKITVLLADDHPIVREGLRSLLQTAPDIEVVAEAADGQQTIDRAKKHLPAVILLDLAMPLMPGTHAIRHLVKAVPASKVLILSTCQDAEIIHAAIEAGAAGYLAKQSACQELLTAIRQINRGQPFFDPHISPKLSATSHNGQNKTPKPALTQRETQVLELVAQGLANKQIADALSISFKTVEKHRQSILDKLNIHNIATLTRYAIAHGLAPL